MESLEISAKTVAEAIQRALEQLGVSREEVEVKVIKEGRTGILGMGAEEAVVRVQILKPAPGETSNVPEQAKETLEKLLSLLGVAASVMPQAPAVADKEEETTTPIAFNIEGDDLGILIGRRGQTLSGLQDIVRLIVSHQTKLWVPIIVDVAGYKQRRYQGLRVLARQMAEQVQAKGTPFTIEPMPADERRIIHLTLADHPDVATQSIGEGEARRVVIMPRQNSL